MSSIQMPLPASYTSPDASAKPDRAKSERSPRPDHTYDDQRSARKERTAKSDHIRTDDTAVETTKDTASTDDSSFLAYFMAGMMTNQNFPVLTTPAPTTDDGAAFVPVTFGGTYNMDPSMLVLPEGVDASALLSAAPDTTASFSSELLTALTPGTPEIPVSAAPVAPVATPVASAIPPPALPATATTVSAADASDPRLIAAGIDPAQMETLLKEIAALNDQAATVPASAASSMTDKPAPDVAVAVISMLPDTRPPKLPPLPDKPIIDRPQFAAISKVKTEAAAPVVQVATDVTVAAAKSDTTATALFTADALPADTAAAPEAEADFDPLEFRLAMKPTRIGSVSPYQQSSAPVPDQPLTAQNNPASPVKGAMHNPAGCNAPVKLDEMMTTGTSDDTATAPMAIVATFDPLAVAIPLTSSTPAQASGITNPVLQNVTAAQSHPTTQTVAAVLARAVVNSGNGAQTLAVQLDPPELGKMQLKMRYEKGEPLKVHVVVEKANTMAMFQRDAHALESALNQAGVQTDSSSLSFSMDQNAFAQAFADQNPSQGGNNGAPSQKAWTPDGSAEDAVIETRMSVFTDAKTGLTHYNIMA